jgi:hypothetical protein
MADNLPEIPKITVKDREHLMRLISETIEKEGPNCDLNFIDVSNQTDLTGVFSYPNGSFNGDISQWNVSEDAYMKLMFCRSPLELEHRIPKWYKP